MKLRPVVLLFCLILLVNVTELNVRDDLSGSADGSVQRAQLAK